MSQSISFWSQQVTAADFPPLPENVESEVVIIGCGIAGLTCAYLLLKEGKSVTILNDGNLLSGQTCRTTGHLTYMLDDRFFDLEEMFGTDGLKLALQSHKEAIDLIERICRDESIECDFERLTSYLFNAPGMPLDILEKEYQALLRAEIKEAQLVPSTFSFFESSKMLSLPQQAQFHALKYISALSHIVQKMGGKIYDAHVVDVSGGKQCAAKTNKNITVKGSFIIVATNTPVNNRFVMHTKQAAYRTYVIAKYIPKDTVPKALYYDTLDPYHYIRVYSESERDLLIIGGEDHKTGQMEDSLSCYDRLLRWTKIRFPFFDKADFEWSGQIIEPVDSLAFIGKNPMEENVFLITGDSGNGLTHSSLGALLIRDLILGKDSPYAKLYDPARKTISLSSLKEFATENLNVGAQYAAWVVPSEEKDIASECGQVIKNKRNKIAVYKDENGEVFQFSAVCPHLGCIVKWNNAEKTWDCPCHGSRFTCKGKVINGPAVSDLEKLS